ncbi:hypothetical protein BELL_0410g00040 [Botrytis elliptica]|uniref:Uncharacterized protein n=1 Tax=Botrytis elliptica TaxID=278938 RepID=A0A4Z1JMX5_9HELO|nr:hypothetical protein BELL_0410g00040 [Botrytis elliptica]
MSSVVNGFSVIGLGNGIALVIKATLSTWVVDGLDGPQDFVKACKAFSEAMSRKFKQKSAEISTLQVADRYLLF